MINHRTRKMGLRKAHFAEQMKYYVCAILFNIQWYNRILRVAIY